MSNVNCNRLLLADPEMTVYWSDYLTKINCKFPNVIQACHMNIVSFDEVNIKYVAIIAIMCFIFIAYIVFSKYATCIWFVI